MPHGAPICCSPTTSRRSAAASRAGWRSSRKRYPAGSLIVSTGSARRPPRSMPRSPTGSIVCRVALAPPPHASRACCSGPGAPPCSPASTDAEFIWCGNIKPAAYPAKWTTERIGHAVRHPAARRRPAHPPAPVHQSAIKRRTARGAARLRRGARGQQRVDPRSLPHACSSELEIDAPPERVRVVPLGADHEVLPSRPRHARGAARATGWTAAAGCCRSRA